MPPPRDRPSSLRRLRRNFQASIERLRLQHLGFVGSQQRKMWRWISGTPCFSALRRCFSTSSQECSNPFIAPTLAARRSTMRPMKSSLRIPLAVVGFLLLSSQLRAPAEAPAAEARPNVLVIMTDDQTVEEMRVLPKTRALLAAKGTTFANSFVSYSLCCPSRSTFLTGQYPHNHGVVANSGPNGGYQRLDSSNTLPVWLRQAGYYTAHLGKYLNNYGVDSPEPPPGWSRWFGLIDPSTYRLYDYTVSDDGVPESRGHAAGDYQTDVLAAEAERVLRSRAGESQPFFVSVAPIAPHLE